MAVLRWLHTNSDEQRLEVLLCYYNELARRFLVEGKWGAAYHLLKIMENRFSSKIREEYRFL